MWAMTNKNSTGKATLKLVPKAAPKLVPEPARKLKLTPEEILSQEPVDEFYLNEGDVLRLLEGGAANGDKNDPVVYTGKAEMQMRRLIAKYAFDRMPLTYGELEAFTDYCRVLDIAAGGWLPGSTDPSVKTTWRANGLKMWERSMADFKPAGALYLDQDLPALLAYHRDNQVMTKLGKRFTEFESEDGIGGRD